MTAIILARIQKYFIQGKQTVGSRYAKAILAISACVALTACGGGGGGASPSVNATTDATPSTALSSPINASNRESHFVLAGNTSGSSTSQELLILDTDTRQIVRKINSANWQASGRLAFDPATRQYRYLGVGNVYFIADGKLFQLDLSEQTLGQAQRITSISNACGLRGIATSTAYDGRHDWLSVRTLDASGQCSQSSLVASDMSTTERGLDTSGANWMAVLSNLPDTLGTPGNLLVLEGATGQLAVYSQDLKTRRYPVAGSPTLGNNDWLDRAIPAPDAAQKAYLQVADKLYLMDWQSGQVVLGAPLAQLPSASEPMLRATDGQSLYFVYQQLIYAASGDRSLRLLAEMDTQLGTARAIANSSGSISVLQETNSNNLDAIRTSLTTFDKLSGKATTLLAASPNIYPWIFPSGDDLILHQFSWDSNPTGYGQSNFLLVKVSQGRVQTLAENVAWFGVIPSSNWSGAESLVHGLLWQQARNDVAYITTPSRDLQAYTMGQDQPHTLGTFPADRPDTAWVSVASWLPNGAVIMRSSDYNDAQPAFWQAQLDADHSLTPVLALP